MRAESAVARITGGTVWRGCDMGGTGIPEVSQEEIMGALGGLDEARHAIFRLKWMLDGSQLRPLERKVLAHIAGWYIHKPKMKPGTLQALGLVAIQEVVMPPICTHCKGSKLEPPQKGEVPTAVKACRKCEGAGVKRMGGRRKAMIASAYREMGRDAWATLEREMNYDRIYRLVAGWEHDAIRHVWRQLNSQDVGVAACG